MLTKLTEYKHPLDVRKGVVRMGRSGERESTQVKGTGRTYFLDVEKTRDGKAYLKIAERRKARVTSGSGIPSTSSQRTLRNLPGSVRNGGEDIDILAVRRGLRVHQRGPQGLFWCRLIC
jgi:hypothetical protein